MLVVCEAPDGTVIRGEVIGGEGVDHLTGLIDLASTFTVQCPDGQCYEVRGWLVSVATIWEVPQRGHVN